ncbi:MAG TPA: O-antigen ligase family protein [Vicinamibacterales bacterium]|nr:O-antigen ligase family protein [Vicinamibacterales bacterium]
MGLAALAIVSPFGARLIASIGVAPIQFTEALTLAMLSGLLIAAAWKPRSNEVRAPSLAPPLAVFITIVLSSLAVVLTVRQVGLDSHRQFFAGLGTFLARDYLISGPEPWAPIGAASQLIEGGLVLALAVHWLRADLTASSRIITATAAAAVIAAAINVAALVPALRDASSMLTVATRLLTSRISVEVTDVNAAGSYFAMASFVAMTLYATSRSLAEHRVWAVGTALLFAALWLTGSRTALVCVAAVIGVAIASTRITWRQRLWPIAAAAILVCIAAAVVIGLDPRAVAGRSLERSFESRAAFLTTGVRMIASAPAFGVGIGRYLEESGRFMPSSIYWFFFRENAHNNFLQIGGELGLVGLAAFLWLIVAAGIRLARGLRGDPGDRLLAGAAAALAAFVATWLTGHPLLTPEVAFPFWILAGAAIARADAHRRSQAPGERTAAGRRPIGASVRLLAAGAIVAIVVPVPLRAQREAARLNLLETSFGFYEWESRPGRDRTRWASPSAAFFVPAGTKEVMIPVRTMFFDRHPVPVRVSIAVDGRVFERFELTNDAWRDVWLQLPSLSSPSAQPRRIDIVTAPPWSLAEVFGMPSARALGVQLSEIVVR